MDESSELKLEPLTDNALASIGRIVRATAEMEDCVDHFISILVGRSVELCRLLIGKSSLRRKAEICQSIAAMSDDWMREVCNIHFGTEFQQFMKIRNAVAHGVYLGKNDAGEFLFQIAATQKFRLLEMFTDVLGVSEESLSQSAENAEAWVKAAEQNFQVLPLREKRRAQPLRDRPPQRTKQNKAVKQKPRPQSSPE
ncbi:hypothetical protein BPTFM16_01983 [Altererythrobacter insulae]|nr:hypothetical protein BPTFM16_01983 [Altererythrobacter insulae]